MGVGVEGVYFQVCEKLVVVSSQEASRVRCEIDVDAV